MKVNYKNCQLIFCSFVPVGLEDYVSYFRQKFEHFTYLRWKFPHSCSAAKSALVEYNDGVETSRRDIFSLPSFTNRLLYFLILPLNYSLYLFQSLYYLWPRKGNELHLFMGSNYFCTLCGVLLKKLGRVDVVIYRSLDFFPIPPRGVYRYLNRFFFIFDRICLTNADFIWFTTEGHIIGREKYGYFSRRERDYCLIPLGLDTSKFFSVPVTRNNRHQLVYCGIISRYHLLDLMFAAIKDLAKEFPEIKLNLIGTGPDEGYFRELSQKMGLQENIVFHGFTPEGEDFKKLMANNLLGIALYRDEEDFMKYTEPAKVKYYLSFGVPAVISDVPVIARELDTKKVSFAVENDKDEIVRTIRDFILDEDRQIKYKENIKSFVKTVDVNDLLERRFKELFAELGHNA
jgi:glycosyltransferase involved in cell wall biosynthesis